MPSFRKALKRRSQAGPPNGPHIPAFDGFRGVAILLVIFFHVGMVSFVGHGSLLAVLGRVQQSAWIGVEMFFTLSGFLITTILLNTRDDPHRVRNFYLRRTLRIFPLYYGVLAVLCVVASVAHLRWNGALPWLIAYVQNFRTAGGALHLILSGPHWSITLQHLWSLAVEEQFYLVWPVLIWACRSRRALLGLSLTVVVLSPLLRWLGMRYGLGFAPLRYWTVFHADSLGWGGLGAVAAKTLSPGRRDLLQRGALTAGALVTAGVLVVEHGAVHEALAATVLVFFSSFGALCCGVLLLLARGGSYLTPLLSLGVLRWCGRYSYGMYVFHYLMMDVLERLRFLVAERSGSRGAGVAALIVAAYGLSAGLAYVSYHAYERRFLKLKDKLARYTGASGARPVGARSADAFSVGWTREKEGNRYDAT